MAQGCHGKRASDRHPAKEDARLTTPSLRVRSIFLVLLLVAFGAGCGSRQTKVDPNVRPLPEYLPEAAVLFDDVFAPELFGFDPEGRDPAKDPRLPDRTKKADFVLPVRVETLSRSGGGKQQGTYEVVLQARGPPMVGKTDQLRFVVLAKAGSPSHSWLEGAGMSWVGTRMLLFGKRFQGPELHFRGEPDTPAVRAAVERGSGLRMLKE